MATTELGGGNDGDGEVPAQEDGLDTVEHRECAKEARRKNKKERVEAEEAEVQQQMAAARGDMRKRLERIGEYGAWITANPDKLQGTLPSSNVLQDSACLRYVIHPIDLKDCCNAC